MKTENKKYVSLLAAIAMLIAYALPFQFTVAAADSVWSASKEATADTELMSGLTPLIDLTFGNGSRTFEDGETYGGWITHSGTNGSWADGKATGTALKFVAPANGGFSVYVADVSKSAYLIEENAVSSKNELSAEVAIDSYMGAALGKKNVVFNADVKKGHVYYVFVDGSKGRFCGAKFVESTTQPTDAPTDAPTDTPTDAPTDVPTAAPTDTPSVTPTAVPTTVPTVSPTTVPTTTPDATSTPDATKEPSDLTDDEKAVRNDAKNLTLKSASQTAVYFDIDLDKKGSNGSAITWESSNSKYIDIQEISHIKRNYTGVVTRPRAEECTEDGGIPVILTATLKKGNAEYKKTFNVSVRAWNPVYYNDFQEDVVTNPDGDYKAIADNVEAVNGDMFRGIRVDTLKESRCFDSFLHGDTDTPQHFDKRIMSTDSKYGRPKALTAETSEEQANGRYNENFAFYYNQYQKHGVNATPLWVQLIDPATKQAPKGVIMMSMDIYVIDGNQKFNIGLGTSKASQMCRFLLGSKSTATFQGYSAAGYVRMFDNESSVDFMGGDKGYRHPVGDWVKAVIVANSNTHKWDFYYDGMQMATGLNFRNAQDMFPTIELMMDRNTTGGKYLIDNIYVENMTEDYRDTYWDALEIPTLSKDESTGYYVAEAPFTLQYQGTDGLTGNMFIWKSSDTDVLNIETKRIPVDELINCGYTAEQVAAYKAQGITNPIVVLASPQNIDKDTVVTVTAKMQIDDELKTKEFKVLVKQNGTVVTGDAQKAREDADAIKCVRNGASITSNVTMETSGSINGSKITWKSSNESVFSANGTVSRPNSNAVTVTLTASVRYGEAVEYRTFNVSVQPSASGGSGGGGGGGSVKPNNSHAINLPGNITGVNTTQPPAENQVIPSNGEAFTDIYKAEWAREAIEYLFSKDVINGYGDGTFGVNDNVTREQFVRMLLTALNIKLTSDKDSEFADVPEGEWYSNYVNSALQLGIVSGISDDMFGVGEEISRQDMAVMCQRAIEFVKGVEPTAEPEETTEPTAEPTAEPEETTKPTDEPTAEPEKTAESTDKPEVIPEITFADKSSIAAYAQRAVALMAQSGYLSGDENGNFAPEKSLTRAEAAAVLYRIMTEGI